MFNGEINKLIKITTPLEHEDHEIRSLNKKLNQRHYPRLKKEKMSIQHLGKLRIQNHSNKFKLTQIIPNGMYQKQFLDVP